MELLNKKWGIMRYNKKAEKHIILIILCIFILCMSFVLEIRSLLKRDFLFLYGGGITDDWLLSNFFNYHGRYCLVFLYTTCRKTNEKKQMEVLYCSIFVFHLKLFIFQIRIGKCRRRCTLILKYKKKGGIILPFKIEYVHVNI